MLCLGHFPRRRRDRRNEDHGRYNNENNTMRLIQTNSSMKTRSILIASAAAAVLLFNSTNASGDTVIKVTLPFQLVSEHSELGSAQDCPDIAWPVQLTGEMHLFVHNDVKDGLN